MLAFSLFYSYATEVQSLHTFNRYAYECSLKENGDDYGYAR